MEAGDVMAPPHEVLQGVAGAVQVAVVLLTAPIARRWYNRWGATPAEVAGVMPGDELDIDFTTGAITYRGDQFHFPPLGSVPQSLVIAQGVENLVAKRLGLA